MDQMEIFNNQEFGSIRTFEQDGKVLFCGKDIAKALGYLHACIKHVEGQQLTNSSLRKRFGVNDSSAGNISRLIKEAVSKQLIKPLDPNTAPRYMKYIPIWA